MATAKSPAGTDAEVLRQAMEIHPGALRYLNPAVLANALDDCLKQLTASPSLAQRYLVLSRFLAKLRCGHTYANFYNQSAEVQESLFKGQTRLPFAFRWLEQGMVVTGAAPGVNLPPGSLITRVDGVDPAEILAQLLPYTRADGVAAGKRRALLEVQHRSRLEFFDVFHGLHFGAPTSGNFRIEGVGPDGREFGLQVPAIDLAARQSMAQSQRANVGKQDPIWQWRVQSGMGVLTMDDWAMYKTEWDWQTWLDARLDEARDLQGLVVDLRANEGGNPIVGAMLLSRLIKAPVSLPTYQRLVRFRSLPDALRAHVGTWDDSFYDIGVGAKAVGRGFYALPEQEQLTLLEPRGARVDVPVAVLTSPTNSSATFTFARVGKASGRVTLVGETTGGNQRGINGDGYFFATLPESGIEFDIPIVGKFPASPQPDAGITPNVAVRETVADIAAGYDRTLETAMTLL